MDVHIHQVNETGTAKHRTLRTQAVQTMGERQARARSTIGHSRCRATERDISRASWPPGDRTRHHPPVRGRAGA